MPHLVRRDENREIPARLVRLPYRGERDAMKKVKPKAKPLNLRQAIEATRQPLNRLGDLVCVQVDSRFGSPYAGMRDLAGDSFACGELRAIFQPDLAGGKTFKQPETENSLIELYANGGRIESLAEFTNEALAMYYDFNAGFFHGNSLAGDAGDSTQFESDIREVLSSLPNVTHEVFLAVRKTTLALYKKYRLASIEGETYIANQKKFQGDKQKIDEKKHSDWREWQAAEIVGNPKFSKLSKEQQAIRLKNKYAIGESSPTIAKRLNPLPKKRQ